VSSIKPLTLNFKNLGAWKYVKVASLIRTEKPAQKHVMLTLAFRADGASGYCHPSYDDLMEDTSYGSKHTIAEAIVYLRDVLKIITWTKGHSNQYRNVANGYTFSLPAMVKVLKEQRDERRAKEEKEAEDAEFSQCTQQNLLSALGEFAECTSPSAECTPVPR
jgi:hypothetical protein